MYVNLPQYDSGFGAYLGESLGCVQVAGDGVERFGDDSKGPGTDVAFLVDDVLHPVPFAQNDKRCLQLWLAEPESGETGHCLLDVLVVGIQRLVKRMLMLSAVRNADREADSSSSDGDGLLEGQDPRVADDNVFAEFEGSHHGVMLREIGQEKTSRRPVEMETKMPATDPGLPAGSELEVTAIFVTPEHPAIERVVGLVYQVDGADGFGGRDEWGYFSTCRGSSWHFLKRYAFRFDDIVLIAREDESCFGIGIHWHET